MGSVVRVDYFGKGPPPLPAATEATVLRIDIAANAAAMSAERMRELCRLGMPWAPFGDRGADSDGSVCSSHAQVNYC